MDRLGQLAGQLKPSAKQTISQKNPDDVVIVAAYRTALTKGGKGKFKDVHSDYILSAFLKEFVAKSKVDVNLIEDVSIGNVLNRSAGALEHRAAALAAGIPYQAGFIAVNRQCSSGLMAISDIANKIKCGEIDCGIGGGVESMSANYGPQNLPQVDMHLRDEASVQKCLIPMGLTNENVASKFGITRVQQDEFSARSYNKAQSAVALGAFKDEILPITVFVKKPAVGDEELDEDDPESYVLVVVDTDEGPRKGVTAESLSKLRPAFSKKGTTHAGNASQVTDGCAAVLLMRRSLAEKRGYPIEAKFVLCSTKGVPPEIMGVGPAVAIPSVLEKTGLAVEDISVFEINEAFAAQCLYSASVLNIPEEKLNLNGGAIALGHPMGATGARQYATILRLLKKGEIGVTSMCIGTGMGAASVLVRE